MQTTFSDKQLKDLENKSSEELSESVYIVVCVMQHVQHIRFLVMS